MRRILLLTILVLAAYRGAYAQGVTTASMTGVVRDAKGDVIPGANVVAIHQPSGTQYGVATRADGYYNIPAMRVGGPYSVTVSFVGFKEQKEENVYLQLGQTLVLNFTLTDESTQLEEVVITATKDPILNSDKMGASTNFSTNDIQRLPSIGRDFRDMTRLTPQASGSFSFAGRSNLYNNLTIDGATVNNVFGLAPLPAGQSNTTPFSLDAIQEITVSLSPYDVRLGNFTGAGISAVTRSGTNELSGSAYYFFRNESMAGKKVDGQEIPLTDFKFSNYGVRLGGPIIKNKAFFFANLEFEKRTEPFYTFPVRANRNESTVGKTQATDDNDPETGLAGLRDFLINNYGYDPGVYKNFPRENNSLRYVVRLDYNINKNHKLTVRGNVTNAFQDQPPSGSGGFVGGPPGGRGNSNNVLSFSSSYYRINNNQYSGTVELNSMLGGGKFHNNLVIGYSAFRDFREDAGGKPTPSFPLVDIIGPNGQNMTTFGPDPFTKNNLLNQDVFQINDNFSIYKRNHIITLGTANEFYRFNNRFTPLVNGVYRYNSLADFYADANPATTATARPAQYTIQYVAVPGGPDAVSAKWSALQLGFFAQDEYTGIKNVKITAGLRVDIPTYLTDLPVNNYINRLDFNGEQLRIGGWPEVRPLWSPRVGFNWDVKGDRSTQVRGGTGVLTGRVPFVWLSNAVSNNGLFFGQFNSTTVPFDLTGDGFPYNFTLDPYVATAEQFADLNAGMPALITNPLDRNYGRPAVVAGVNTLDKNFRFPQVWRSSLAVDQKLPFGLVGTAEFIVTKDINAVYIRDANLAPAVARLNGDGRPLFGAVPGSPTVDRAIIANDRRLQGDVSQALVLTNTNKGYQWSATFQLRKQFSRGFEMTVAYNYTDAREINPQTAATAGSVFSSQAHVNGPNNPELSYAAALTPHRVIVYGSYRKEYARHFATTLGFSFEGRSGNNFSYVYQGDLNSDGIAGNDLIYIPRNKNEIVLSTSSATDNRSLDEIWTQLDNYIKQDPYLSKRRGQYAERNGAISPWVNYLSLNLLQDFYIEAGGKRHTLQLSATIENVLNLLNSEWGLIQNPARTQLIRFLGYELPHTAGTVSSPVDANGNPWRATTGKPVFAFDTNADGTPLTNSFVPLQTVGGRWQMQLGVRYIF
ncbi:MAG: carboxypeptidase regulatory-like domain-containing protein [Cyclobacteriaceae bacterium]|nr:carboxypeptidase regulatory-like domain-containing protein [Cyclobacteriaceae bacterium]MCX7637164.1 carboxypeptidase regulatory-like domain-containing protein [Cyclobacteriaceae bacterium]MDW8330349.1 carboxypeptidase regulatory-like domain-containing protein [Cyclobacteriaceae bacterium]